MARILIVDDEASIRTTVCTLLRHEGHAVAVAEDADAAQSLLAAAEYDVVLSDIVLPRISGVELLRQIRASAPHVQVIMMTGEPTVETASEAVRLGAADYLAKPVLKEQLIRAVAQAVRIKELDDERRRLAEANRVYQQDLERLVRERTQQMEEALRGWQAAAEGTILAMASAVESRDPYTAGHQRGVAELGRAIAQELGLAAAQIQGVYYAGIVHDVGKISVPAEILSSPATLCDEAMGLIRKHPRTGYEILRKILFPWPVAEIVLQHHERMDGSGYPQGLRGEAIGLEARILAVADVVEAMASHRPYRAALGIETALAEIGQHRGTLYDARAVDACVRLFREKGFAFGIRQGREGPGQ